MSHTHKKCYCEPDYDEMERQCDEYEAYLKDLEKAREQAHAHYLATHTSSGVPLYKLVHVTDIPYLDGGAAAVNWNPETNQFIVCEPGEQDWFIDRTEESLRAFANILAFNPKEWGCQRCGCSAESKDKERICWCDTCQDGCDTPIRIERQELAPPRAKSQFLTRRGSLPPPPVVPLQRLTAVGSDYTHFEPAPISPNNSPSPIPLSAEDFLRFKSS